MKPVILALPALDLGLYLVVETSTFLRMCI